MNRIIPPLLALLALGPTARPRADDAPKAPADAPEARARLDALIAAYRKLDHYADRGTTRLAVVVAGRRVETERKASVAYDRPNRVDVETDLVRVVSDGATLTTAVAPLKTYQSVPAPKAVAEPILRGGPLGAIEFGGVAGRPLAYVLSFVLGDGAARLVDDFAPKIAIEPDAVEGEATYRVLRLDEAENYDWRLLIDPKTGLLAHVDLVVKGDAARSSVVGGDTHVAMLRWSAGSIEVGPPPADRFAFRAPEGYKAVEKLEAKAAPGGAEPEKPR